MHWIFKNKDQGKAAAAASLGMITLWDVEGGLPQIDKYLYSKDSHVVAGAPSAAASQALAEPRVRRQLCWRRLGACLPVGAASQPRALPGLAHASARPACGLCQGATWGAAEPLQLPEGRRTWARV